MLDYDSRKSFYLGKDFICIFKPALSLQKKIFVVIFHSYSKNLKGF